jgi:hypothetical protein
VAIFWKRARWWILGFGVLFHLMTLPLMNIFFPHQLAMYLIFVDWNKVTTGVSKSSIRKRAVTW